MMLLAAVLPIVDAGSILCQMYHSHSVRSIERIVDAAVVVAGECGVVVGSSCLNRLSTTSSLVDGSSPIASKWPKLTKGQL
jgi:hypothetical protein